jgi:hypothetical protein
MALPQFGPSPKYHDKESPIIIIMYVLPGTILITPGGKPA